MIEQKDIPMLPFKTPKSWRAWLETHYATEPQGLWLRLYKKGRGQSITYAEALDEALCFGWIDGQKKSYDDDSYLQKFTPRRTRSLWSKRNIEHIERLTQEGRMTPAGQAEVDAARADGRWDRAYDAPSNAQIPGDFLAALDASPKAKAFFETLNKTNRYAIVWRLQTAKKEETRQRRMQQLLTMLERGEKIH